jgi:hypothetical protein
MTSSRTITSSFTITAARYVGAKIGADLRLLNNMHGRSFTVRGSSRLQTFRCCSRVAR